ncbi:MAG TPA: DUF2087 domain-containing protein [Mycobacteriales bacterium]|nr:DUF2087 domain-containing protein [Mycobacteriales bacterium]
MRSAALIDMLADPERLRVVAALVLGADTPHEVAGRADLGPAVAARALRRLTASGLVSQRDGRIVLHADLFARAAQAARAEEPRPEPSDQGITDPATAAVLRAFVRDGRLVSIPAAAGRRRVLLEYLAGMFEPGVRYPETDVNAMLRAWHPDHASLRRYLVDAGLMSREAGEYWRSGGWADQPPAGPVPEPTRPAVREQRVAAYGLATDAGRVLLTRLAPSTHPHAGSWTLPGGGLRFGERPVRALRREVYEETGLTVGEAELLDVESESMSFQRHGAPVEGHPIRILYRISTAGGPLGVREIGGSTAEVAWLDRSDLAAVPLTPYAAAAIHTSRL